MANTTNSDKDGAGLYSAIGVPGYRWWGAGGYGDRTGAVDEEWHPQLRGKQGVKFYREMMDEDVSIGASFYLIESVIRRVPWYAKQASQHPAALAAAERLDGAFKDMDASWTDTVSEILSFMGFGWALCEQTWKRCLGDKPPPGPDGRPQLSSRFSDGRIGWASIELRAQETLDFWEFDARGVAIGMWQRAAPDFQRRLIPLDKAILFRSKSNKGSPEGRSLLRNGRRPYFFAKRLEEFEALGLEKDLTSQVVFRLPLEFMEEGASVEKKRVRAEYERIARGAKRNEFAGFVLPAKKNPITGMDTGFDMDLLQSIGRAPLNPAEAITRHRQDLAMLLMTQFQRLGMDKAGSRAVSTDQTDILQLALASIVDMIEQQMGPAVDDLQAMNGIPAEHRATWCHGDIDELDAAKFAEALSKVVTAGVVTPDAPLEDHVREVLKYPPREDAPPPPDPDGADLPPETDDAAALQASPLGAPGVPDADPLEPPAAPLGSVQPTRRG